MEKRCIYIAAMFTAEDSGCLFWNAANLLDALPRESDMSEEDVEQYMIELEADDYAWKYEVDGMRCAYLPAFPDWQSSLTRWSAPRAVPTPPGLCYIAHETKNRYGSVEYRWLKSKTEMMTPWKELSAKP